MTGGYRPSVSITDWGLLPFSRKACPTSPPRQTGPTWHPHRAGTRKSGVSAAVDAAPRPVGRQRALPATSRARQLDPSVPSRDQAARRRHGRPSLPLRRTDLLHQPWRAPGDRPGVGRRRRAGGRWRTAERQSRRFGDVSHRRPPLGRGSDGFVGLGALATSRWRISRPGTRTSKLPATSGWSSPAAWASNPSPSPLLALFLAVATIAVANLAAVLPGRVASRTRAAVVLRSE